MAGSQLWRVGRITDLDAVVEDDAVGVVDNLGTQRLSSFHNRLPGLKSRLRIPPSPLGRATSTSVRWG
jgi:hypothetical protein